MKENKYNIGIDLAIKPNWWKRFLVWLRIKRRDWDYSCMVITRRQKNGIIKIIDKTDF